MDIIVVAGGAVLLLVVVILLVARLTAQQNIDRIDIRQEDGERPTRPIEVDTRKAYEKFKQDTQSRRYPEPSNGD